MPHSLIKANFLLVIFACYGSTATLDHADKFKIHLKNEGMVGGKINSDVGQDYYEPMNNHGFFYNSFLLECSYLESVTLITRLRVLNEEMSVFDQYQCFFEPEIALSFKLKKLETSFRGGYINDFTLGNGLTVKDLSNSGGIVTIRLNNWAGSGGVLP